MNKTSNEIKSISLDMINKAQSGHPGMVLGGGHFLVELFLNHLNIDKNNPNWINRDRFIMSSGHVSSIYYVLLHLSGFDISLDDLKKFRHINSKTPGHPESFITSGVDATTGPLGQGIAMGVGMALSSKMLKDRFDKEGYSLFDNKIYVWCGDGDLQEGISYEATSFASNYNLDNLILIYDKNNTTLDASLDKTSNEDVEKRFKALNFNVYKVKKDNLSNFNKCIDKAKKSSKPSLVLFESIIGRGSINEGSFKTHGAPLLRKDLENVKEKLNIDKKEFMISKETYNQFENKSIKRGKDAYFIWNETLKKYKQDFPSLYKQFSEFINLDFDFANLASLKEDGATRKTLGTFLNTISTKNPFIVGGSADVASSTKAVINDSDHISKGNFKGKNIRFGIREFAMASIGNGMALYGGLYPYASTFLAFSDYMKPAIRLSALMDLPILYIFSHDSVALGEDGPTHQPIEQLTMLRTIPNITLYRPGNLVEVQYSLIQALKNKKPAVIVTTRQNVTTYNTLTKKEFENGAYIAKKENGAFFDLLVSGSELESAFLIAKKLEKDNLKVNIISVPNFNNFDSLSTKEKEKILINGYNKTISFELGITTIWEKYAKYNIGIKTFGASGKKDDVLKSLNLDVNSVYERIKKIITSK